jgi:hypothetical protein
MNIFVLDENPKLAAQYHVNSHASKMCVEYAQLLCSVHHITKNDDNKTIPYRLTHKNHPSSIWARECIENYIWLTDLANETCKEYSHRYGRRHKSQDVVDWAICNLPELKENGELTEFALAMPDECKVGSAVESYREYYRTHKAHIAKYTNRNKPEWF